MEKTIVLEEMSKQRDGILSFQETIQYFISETGDNKLLIAQTVIVIENGYTTTKFFVTHNDDVVLKTSFLFAAVECYNRIEEITWMI